MAATRRDIIQKVKVDAEDIANKVGWLNRYFTANPAVAGPAKDIVDGVVANAAAITTAMGAYAAADTTAEDVP